MVSRAVHIEVICGYDSNSFLMALSRFASIRGWPQYIYSDPGSQLVGAEKELKEAWEKIDRNELNKKCVQNGLKWVFGSADSPRQQGAVESLVKARKEQYASRLESSVLRCLNFLRCVPKLLTC